MYAEDVFLEVIFNQNYLKTTLNINDQYCINDQLGCLFVFFSRKDIILHVAQCFKSLLSYF